MRKVWFSLVVFANPQTKIFQSTINISLIPYKKVDFFSYSAARWHSIGYTNMGTVDSKILTSSCHNAVVVIKTGYNLSNTAILYELFTKVDSHNMVGLKIM